MTSSQPLSCNRSMLFVPSIPLCSNHLAVDFFSSSSSISSKNEVHLPHSHQPRSLRHQCAVRAVLQELPSQKKSSKPKKPQPGEAGHRFFEFPRERIEAVRIRHLLVDTEELCASIRTSIASHQTTLAEVASTVSTCEASRVKGGDIGWWKYDDLVPSGTPNALVDDSLLEKALTCRPNVIQTHQSIHGYHLFIVEDSKHFLQMQKLNLPMKINPNQSFKKNKLFQEFTKPIKNTYTIQTLGCQMNRSDSERMAGVLEHLGYTYIEDSFQCELLVLNTCNIREHAETKVYSYLGKHKLRKRKFPTDTILAVSGCVAQQEGENMLRRIPELDLVFGPQYVNRIDELLKEIKQNQCQISATEPTHITEDITKPKRQSKTTAWVNVIYGCGENCSFCTVGNVVRTVEQSRTMDSIKSEIEDIAKDGIREIVLLGQNIDAYGRDMNPKKTFAQLLKHVHDVKGIDRIRFTTSHPRYISDGLAKVCANLPKIMPFFHIPPQSGDSYILKVMKRGYTVETFINVVNRIRSHIPDAAIAGDMIVGFPGETEEQFQKSLNLIEDIGFDVMNTAAYSPRPQTPAATYDDQIDEDVKSDRLRRMNEVVSKVALRRSERYVGRTEEVLVEQANPKREGEVVGRTPNNRPVYFKGSINELEGKLVDVKISKAFPFSLQGEKVGDPR